MMRIRTAALLWGTVAGLALSWACSDGGGSPSDEAGGAGGDDASGDGADGDASSGGSSSTGGSTSSGGSGTGGAAEPAEICSDAGGTTRCAEFPAACGSRADYVGALFNSAGPDDLKELSIKSNSVYFGLEGDDELTGFGNGSCLVGGDGNDTFEFGNDPVAPRPNVGIGGPGLDVWVLDHPAEPPRLADVAVDEEIRFKAIGTFEADFIEFIEGYSGTQSKAPTTHIVYAPDSGEIWLDEDGGGTSETPTLLAIVSNHAEVALTLANFAIAD
ncbi:MAG TPA: hypothetical protein VLC09_13315 [Polyangiaceae bacterium]|nr:hypothetical protein [Polyangiaceae bacterium]